MKKWKQLLAATALVLGVGIAFVPAHSASAVDIISSGCKGISSSAVCKSKGDQAIPLTKIVVNTLLFVLGMVAVIMIIIGGVRYTTSNGESSAIKAAKDTILYSVIGLVVAILAYAIVNFVVDRF